MEYIKLQIGCMILVLYITYIHFKEKSEYHPEKKDRLFEGMLGLGIISILFDGLTAYTVNHLDTIPGLLNMILHLGFLLCLHSMVFMMFLYMLNITEGIPENRKIRRLMSLPFVINTLILILFIPRLSYRHGEITNYSMGISVYVCYASVAVYFFAAGWSYLHNWKNIERYKQITISTFLVTAIGVTVYQMIFPEALITSLVPVLVVLSAYLNQENPLFTRLQKYHDEMVMGFATLVENRDDSTGGHIHRTTAYVELLAKELKKRGFYQEELTRDYIKNLVMAAPMHDVGKISIPDSILQKPGKLTDEEFEIMKTHSERGGKIIQETFGHLGRDAYENIAYDVARHHHEKWNGKGYPDGLKEEEIPLCARIMSIADVFDAVSAKRCYRDALPLDVCFKIIEEGSGRDFDPVMAEVFLDMKERIVEVYERNSSYCS